MHVSPLQTSATEWRGIHDTLGHYLTVIHVQLEAVRAVMGSDADRGMLALTRAQALAKDGLAAVRQSVRALREDATVESVAEQIAALVDSVRDERFSATFTSTGTPRPVSAAVALALHRTTLEALTSVRKHADAHVTPSTVAMTGVWPQPRVMGGVSALGTTT